MRIAGRLAPERRDNSMSETTPSKPFRALAGPLAGLLALSLAVPAAARLDNGPPIAIRRLTAPVTVDGELSDPGWADSTPVDSWFETNPGDNLEPRVKNLARLAYDDRYLYAAFEFDDPDPRAIRAPLGDRDVVPSYTDYGGVILDPRGDGKTAQMFLANARGIQYDAISSDATGEDSSPDFYWESAGRVVEGGWRLEMRIPFSSIRYVDPNPDHWGILLYRNQPRDYRYQYFSSRLPRERNCFICNVRDLTGMKELPRGGHWVVAPYATAGQAQRAAGGAGGRLETGSAEFDGGADVKWLPNPDTVLDATINPDFSQIELDSAEITANERFALFLPEKRPFFLESVDLFSTPIQAVYTRTFGSPRWGARATGGSEKTKYTMLVGEDRGGGSVILPGAEGSDLAHQDFGSWVAIGRVRREVGNSFVSFLYSGRELDGGGFNRVVGPDFEWRPTEQDTVSGQLLWSASETPDRPDLATEWDGRSLSGHAAELWWNRSTGTWDYFLIGRDLGDEFRADNGFVPQVGYRRAGGEIGRTFRPVERPVRRIRLFGYGEYNADAEGRLLLRLLTAGFGLDAPLNSFVRVELGADDVRSGAEIYRRYQVRPTIEVKPGRVLSRVYLEANLGDQVDFANSRAATGGTVILESDLRPTDHLQLSLGATRRWLDVDAGGRGSARLLTAQVASLKAVYTFDARSWLRLIGQYVDTERDVALYTDEVDRRSTGFAGSLVFAYKLNWQTVLYLGVSDNRELDPEENLEPADRQAFLKISYAFRG
jgi:hypothetical protein